MRELDRNGREILVVDDDPDQAHTFAALLKELGHAAEYVTSPQAVLDMAKRMKPWLIFLDISMPGANGWELAPVLKRELGHHAVRLVAVAATAIPSTTSVAAKPVLT